MRRNRSPVSHRTTLANAQAKYCRWCGLFATDNTTQARIQGGICASCRTREPFRLRKKAISQWAQQMLQQDGWVMLDTETTGLERDDEVIELAVIGKDGTVLLDTLVRPQGRTDRSRFVRRSVMADRLKKEDFVRLLATRMNADEAAATAWVDGVVETLYESFKAGDSVTLPGFGGFYVRQEPESWVFKFNPGQRLRALFGWSSTYSGKL